MSLQEIVITLRRAEGVKLVLGFRGKWHSQLNDCSLQQIIFPDEATPGSLDLFEQLRNDAETRLKVFVWPSYEHSNNLKLAETFAGKLIVEVFSKKATDKLVRGTELRLHPRKRSGQATGPYIWNDKVKKVDT